MGFFDGLDESNFGGKALKPLDFLGVEVTVTSYKWQTSSQYPDKPFLMLTAEVDGEEKEIMCGYKPIKDFFIAAEAAGNTFEPFVCEFIRVGERSAKLHILPGAPVTSRKRAKATEVTE